MQNLTKTQDFFRQKSAKICGKPRFFAQISVENFVETVENLDKSRVFDKNKKIVMWKTFFHEGMIF